MKFTAHCLINNIVVSLTSVLVFSTCTKSDFTKSIENFRSVYLYGPMQMATFMAIDVDQNGQVDDFTWMKAETTKPDNVALFYNEMYKKGKLYAQTWYGPSNYKIVQKSDVNEDGRLESTVYYNNQAKAGVIGLIVARLEVDHTNNQKTDVWVYPDTRMEIDTNADGQPDIFTMDKKIIFENRKLLQDNKSKITTLKGKPLTSSQSWALHPELIKNPEFQAIIPRSL